MEPLGKPLAFAPGQFLFVSFRSLALASSSTPSSSPSRRRCLLDSRRARSRNQFHPFSITSAPDEPELRITVKAVGDYTRALRQLEAGADAVVEGPYGSFSPERRRPKADLDGGWNRRDAVSEHGAQPRRDDDAVGRLLLLRRARGGGALPRRAARDRAEPSDSASPRAARSRRLPHGGAGRREHAELASADVLVCGPPAMIESLRSQLHASAAAASGSTPRSSGSPRSDGARTARAMSAAEERRTAAERPRHRHGRGRPARGDRARRARRSGALRRQAPARRRAHRARRRAASTPRSGRWIPRTAGSSTPPTRCGRATGWPTRSASSSSAARRRARSTISCARARSLAREDDGRLTQRFFGAHRWRRTCFAGDYTGREIQRVARSGAPRSSASRCATTCTSRACSCTTAASSARTASTSTTGAAG